MVLADQAAPGVNIDRVIRMLLLHDLVEIDVGDTRSIPRTAKPTGPPPSPRPRQGPPTASSASSPPIRHRPSAPSGTSSKPPKPPTPSFAKSLDRVQPVMANLQSGGGTWNEYGVTREQLESRVGAKVMRGAPAVWAGLKSRLDAWFGPTPNSPD